MDRKDRTMIFEPLLLMLKQRTGIVVILTIIILLLSKALDIDNEIAITISGLVISYVLKQGYVDGQEAAQKIKNALEEEVKHIANKE